jgi:hypothetical protein
VDEDVDRPDLTSEAGDELCDLGIVGQIGTVHEGAGRSPRHLAGDILQSLRAAAYQADPHAFRSEGQRDGSPDTAARSRNYCCLTG